MTRIVARYENEGYSLVAAGHATGSVQACAGVSALLYALVGWLKSAEIEHCASIGKGEAMIVFRKSEGAEAAMDVTVIGLDLIAQNEPEAVEVTIYHGDNPI